LITPACEIFFIPNTSLIVTDTSIHHIARCKVRLSLKHIDDSFCCIRLKFLMFKFEFQLNPPIVLECLYRVLKA